MYSIELWLYLLYLSKCPYIVIFLLVKIRLNSYTTSNFTPPNETPMLVDSSGKGNFLPDFRAGRSVKDNFSEIGFDGQNFTARRSGTNVDHEGLRSLKFGDFGFLHVVRLDTE